MWPGGGAPAEAARAVVWVCLLMAGGCDTRSSGGSRVTMPAEGTRIGDILALHHPGLLARMGMKLLQFLRKPQQSPFFILTTSGSGTVSLNLDALHEAARQADATKFVVLSPSTCVTSRALKVSLLSEHISNESRFL